ncbi:hypothetical protein JOC54_002331 [Alkalihalobacillus xiaoxiensis]|uniref:DNA-binding protein n=2 Tax=Shouchella xiaoxiensis TaxID=766895 RepID=A0ABS2SU79_9BACI|nr:hypothetical protein [Shouchella xiaoxiensis]
MDGMFWLAIGIIGFGYFIGDGIKNFKNHSTSHLTDMFSDEKPKLIKEKDLHYYLNLSKEDAKELVKSYPSVPHLNINGSIYYPAEKLDSWLASLDHD